MILKDLLKRLNEIKEEYGEDIDIGSLIEFEGENGEHTHLIYATILDEFDEFVTDVDDKKYVGFYVQPILEIEGEEDLESEDK